MSEQPTEFLLVKVSDQDLDDVVLALRALHKSHAVAHAVAVGALLVQRFYQGDYAAARSRDPQKHVYYRELIERRGDELADLALPDRTLQRCVAATDTWRGLPEEVRAQLGVVHLSGLAAVTDTNKRQQLAYDAATLRWTGEQVKLAVADQKKKARGTKAKPGRKEKPQVLKAAVAARAELRKVTRAQVGQLKGAELREMQSVLAEIRAMVSKALAG